jgi:hypothetical protein
LIGKALHDTAQELLLSNRCADDQWFCWLVSLRLVLFFSLSVVVQSIGIEAAVRYGRSSYYLVIGYWRSADAYPSESCDLALWKQGDRAECGVEYA